MVANASPNPGASMNRQQRRQAARSARKSQHRRGATRAQNGSAEMLKNLATTLSRQGKLDQAIVSYQQALAIEPDHAEINNNLGNCLMTQGKHGEAAAHFRRALARNPAYAEAHNNLGNALSEQGKLDDAVLCFQTATGINPNFAEAHSNMGLTLQEQGNIGEAIVQFQRAIDINPNLAEVFYNLGLAFRARGQEAEALTCLRRAVELKPSLNAGSHMLAALSGAASTAAPADYVRALFDKYAANFDQHIVEALEYKMPDILRRSLDDFLRSEIHFENAIDLGCGTGLSGRPFRQLAGRLVGVDLSPRMIEEAEKKKLYDHLEVTDVVEFLHRSDRTYDLFIAADVFIYLGDLEPIFSAMEGCTQPRAFVLCSTEPCEGDSYKLLKSGRYAHSRNYIDAVARRHGFEVVSCHPETLRKEGTETIMGEAYVLRAAS